MVNHQRQKDLRIEVSAGVHLVPPPFIAVSPDWLHFTRCLGRCRIAPRSPIGPHWIKRSAKDRIKWSISANSWVLPKNKIKVVLWIEFRTQHYDKYHHETIISYNSRCNPFIEKWKNKHSNLDYWNNQAYNCHVFTFKNQPVSASENFAV